MTDHNENQPHTANLRQQAEERLLARPAAGASVTPAEAGRLLHELQVHQIELEMQNEELRRAQQELETTRARYFDLYNFAPVGYVTVSESGFILEANLTAAIMLGVDRNALVKQRFTHFIVPDDQDIYYQHRQQLFKTGAPQTCELRLVKQAGDSFWVRLEATRAQDGESSAPLCRVVLSDITTRQQVEETLRESEASLKFSQQVAHVGHWTWDTVANRVAWSDEMYHIFGLNPATFDGDLDKIILQAIHPDDREKVINSNNAVLTTQKPTPLEYRVVWPDQSVRTVWAEAGKKVIDSNGKILKLSGIVQDITERKQAEEALACALDERNILFHELQHRIKNTFTMIIALVQMEAEQAADSCTKDVLENFNRRLYPLADLYTMLFTSGDTQQIRLDWYLDEIAKALVGAFMVGQERVALRLNLDEITVSAKNASAFGLILNELLTNALKYAFPGDRRGVVSVGLKRDTGDVTLAVANNGVELPTDFDITQSHGLGLTLTRILVQQLGGKVYYERGAETRFVVRVNEAQLTRAETPGRGEDTKR